MTQAAKGNVSGLPDTFQFDTRYGSERCTAAKQPDGDYMVTWSKYSRTVSKEELFGGVSTGAFTILTNEKQTTVGEILAATNASQDAWKQHVEALDNDSQRTDDSEGETANVLFDELMSFVAEDDYVSNTAEDRELDEYIFGDGCDECCCEDISLSQYLREFTENTGCDILIADGEYSLHYNEMTFNACCEDNLVELCGAITVLHMALVK